MSTMWNVSVWDMTELAKKIEVKAFHEAGTALLCFSWFLDI